jgi:subtilisin family serine protease
MEKYVVLRMKQQLHEIESFSLTRSATRSRDDSHTSSDLASAFEVQTLEGTPKEARDLKRDPEVQAFAPNMQIRLYEPVARDTGSHEESGVAWGVRAVKANTSIFTGKGVTVAVLDTGIDADHPAFKGVDLIQQDFTGEGDGDANGHGTHCAGIIFGQTHKGLRMGVAPGIERALIGKVLDAKGAGSTDSIALGIQWALHGGAHVLSMSLGMDFPGMVQYLVEEERLPIATATSRALEVYRANVDLFGALADLARKQGVQGIVIVAASGNESQRESGANYVIAVSPPASADGIYAVGALGQSEGGLTIADFSNTNVDVAAPGVEITSAKKGGGLVSMSGTSMATPHVAGVAALWAEKLMSRTGRLDPTGFAAKLVASGTLDGLAEPVDVAAVGTGIVQAPQS